MYDGVCILVHDDHTFLDVFLKMFNPLIWKAELHRGIGIDGERLNSSFIGLLPQRPQWAGLGQVKAMSQWLHSGLSRGFRDPITWAIILCFCITRELTRSQPRLQLRIAKANTGTHMRCWWSVTPQLQPPYTCFYAYVVYTKKLT